MVSNGAIKLHKSTVCGRCCAAAPHQHSMSASWITKICCSYSCGKREVAEIVFGFANSSFRLRFAVGVAPQRPSALSDCFVIKEMCRSYSSGNAEIASNCRNLFGEARNTCFVVNLAEHVLFYVFENVYSLLNV